MEEHFNLMPPLQTYSTSLQPGAFSMTDQSYMPLDNFEWELASYMQGDIHFGMSGDWNI